MAAGVSCSGANRARREEPGGRRVMRTRAKLGEMTMRVELQAELLENGGTGMSLGSSLRRLNG